MLSSCASTPFPSFLALGAHSKSKHVALYDSMNSSICWSLTNSSAPALGT